MEQIASTTLSNVNNTSSSSPSPNPSKIFWPRDQHSTTPLRPGILVGWNIRSFIACIAAVVSDVDISDLERFLESLSHTSPPASTIDHMSKACGGVRPVVLGILRTAESHSNSSPGSSRISNRAIAEHRDRANLWLTLQVMEGSSEFPALQSIYCCGSRYSPISTEFIFYSPPNPFSLQRISLSALELDVTLDDIIKLQLNTDDESPVTQSLDKRRAERLHFHSQYVSIAQKSSRNELKILVSQVNCAQDLQSMIQNKFPYSVTKSVSVGDSFLNWIRHFVVLIRTTVLFISLSKFWAIFKSVAVWPIILYLFSSRIAAESLMYILNYKFVPSWLWPQLAIKDISSVALQIDMRLQQTCFWPWQWIVFRRTGWRYSAANRTHYISFYNTMWLVANDVIIGIAFGTFLVDNYELIAEFVTELHEHYAVSALKSAVVWLMGWPAGLKLNNNLDRFLGELFLWLIYLWTEIFGLILPYIPVFVKVIGFSGVLGASMIVSCLADFLTLCTVHIYVFYSIAARIYNWQLSVLWSLFNLFRGKKYNVLRDRLDSCDYDLDQLLLGTILFTLLFFLFPTVVVYYLLFCTARITVIGVQIVLKTMLAVLNHFPLFTLMLRFKDPLRLPGGIRLDIRTPIVNESLFSRLSRTPTGSKSSTPAVSGTPRLRSRDSSSSQTGMAPTLAFSMTSSFDKPLVPEILSRRLSQFLHSPSTFDEIPVTTYLHLYNIPIPVSSIFFQYLLLWRRLTAHYISWRVIKYLVYGEPIKPGPVLQYPMLPEQRPPLPLFWKLLTDPDNHWI